MGFLPVAGTTPPAVKWSVIPGFPSQLNLLFPDDETPPSWTLKIDGGDSVLSSIDGQMMCFALSAAQTETAVGRSWVLVDGDDMVKVGGPFERWIGSGAPPSPSVRLTTGGTVVGLALAAVGPPGPKSEVPGPAGPPGPVLVPTGAVADEASLPVSGADGDFYITEDDGHGWSWLEGMWLDLGPVRGPTGPPGDPADLIPLLPELVAGNGLDLVETPGFLTMSALASDDQEFTASGTWTKPTGAKVVIVLLIQGGGGGGSGRKGAEGTDRFGGGGGPGGATTWAMLPASALGSTVTVTVGAGGTGGAVRTTDSQDGANGTAGGATSFGTVVPGLASDIGYAGTATAGNGGAVTGSSLTAGSGGASASFGGIFAFPGTAGHTGGGGGGAWRNAANASALAPGAGGASPIASPAISGANGAAGANGIGGGGGSGGAVGVTGGNGGYPGGGGGGGGAGINGSPGTPSGKGGPGGGGYARVITIR